MDTLTIDQYAAAHKLKAGLLAEIYAERVNADVNGSTALPVSELDDIASVIEDAATEDLMDALEEVQDARRLLSDAEANLQRAVKDALTEGVSAVRIGKVLGVSRARVYQIRDGKR